MKRVNKSELWSNTPFKFGTYKNRKTGKIAVARKPSGEDAKRYDWEIDKGKKRNHPFLRISIPYCECGTGNYFFNKILKDYDFIEVQNEFN